MIPYAEFIPFVDLRTQYENLKEEIDDAIRRALEESAFIGGERVRAFAESFSEAMGGHYFAPVANGTDALYIILRRLGVGPGDEVLVPAMSWIASSEVVTALGAVPVFVDVDEHYHLDPSLVRARITPKSRVIMPVHLYGQPVEMGPLMSIAEDLGLGVVEDCAQAHLARYHGQLVGGFGAAAGFSFFPGKNLGAYGDAGGILSTSAEFAESCRFYANHGQARKHDHRMEGANSRLDSIQAAVLSVKLPYLPAWTEARRRVADWYDELLGDLPEVKTPKRRDDCYHVFHLYVIQAEARDRLADHLREKGISTGIHYPQPLPLMSVYAHLNHSPEEFPRASAAKERILSLPIFPELTRPAVEKVSTEIRRFYER